jgi:hypothetical protein
MLPLPHSVRVLLHGGRLGHHLPDSHHRLPLPCLQLPLKTHVPVMVVKWAVMSAAGCLVDRQLLNSSWQAAWRVQGLLSLAVMVGASSLGVAWLEAKAWRSYAAAAAAAAGTAAQQHGVGVSQGQGGSRQGAAGRGKGSPGKEARADSKGGEMDPEASPCRQAAPAAGPAEVSDVASITRQATSQHPGAVSGCRKQEEHLSQAAGSSDLLHDAALAAGVPSLQATCTAAAAL